MAVLGKLCACALNVRLLLVRLSNKFVEIPIQLGSVLLSLLGIEEVFGEFGGSAGLIRNASTGNTRIGICNRNEEVGRRLTVGGLVPVIIAYGKQLVSRVDYF